MKRKFMGIYIKELKVFFSMPVAYVVAAVFTMLSGYFFANIANYYAMVSLRSMNQYHRMAADLNMVDGIFRPYFQNIVVVLILMIPLITMRVFAEEKREGTAELLFTFPVSDITVVTAKFSAAMTVFFAMLAGGAVSFLTLRGVAAFESLPVITGFLGLILLGGAFVMMGLFISSLTESQIVAAVISFGVLLLLLVLPWVAQSAGPGLSKVLLNLSVVRHFDSFAKGTLDTSDMIFYINFMVLFFFLTLRMLESKQWRG